MNKMLYIAGLIFIISCENSFEEDDETYHTDSNYKYENRTGTSGDYNYNYDIYGTDENGKDVSGNIDINGKYGAGTIEDEYGNEKDIDVEWVGNGQMEGTDEDGNSYEFQVE